MNKRQVVEQFYMFLREEMHYSEADARASVGSADWHQMEEVASVYQYKVPIHEHWELLYQQGFLPVENNSTPMLINP